MLTCDPLQLYIIRQCQIRIVRLLTFEQNAKMKKRIILKKVCNERPAALVTGGAGFIGAHVAEFC